jgi:hypothetical protein
LRTALLKEIVEIQDELVSDNIANEIANLMDFSAGDFGGENTVEDK